MKRVGGNVMKEQISLEQICKFNEEYNKNKNNKIIENVFDVGNKEE